MRLFSALMVCLFLAVPPVLNSAVTTTAVSVPSETHKEFTSLKIKEVEKIIGRKLTLKEKISFLVFKHSAKKGANEGNKGRTALGFGIAGAAMLILGLFIPYVILGALAAGIVAVALGYAAKRQDPSDNNARTAVLLGWITLGLFVVILAAAVAYAASYGWF